MTHVDRWATWVAFRTGVCLRISLHILGSKNAKRDVAVQVKEISVLVLIELGFASIANSILCTLWNKSYRSCHSFFFLFGIICGTKFVTPLNLLAGIFQAWSCFLISTNLDVYLFIRFMATWSKRRMLSSLDWEKRYLNTWAMIVFLDKTCCKLPPKSSAIIRTSPKILTVLREWTQRCDCLKKTQKKLRESFAQILHGIFWLANLRNP